MPECVANPSTTVPECSRLLFSQSQVDFTVPKLVADSGLINGLAKALTSCMRHLKSLLFPRCYCVREAASEVLIFICPRGLVRSVCVKAGGIEKGFIIQRKVADVGLIQNLELRVTDSTNCFLWCDTEVDII